MRLFKVKDKRTFCAIKSLKDLGVPLSDMSFVNGMEVAVETRERQRPERGQDLAAEQQ